MRTETTVCLSGLGLGLLLMSPLNRHAKHLRWKVGIPLTAISSVALAILSRPTTEPALRPNRVPSEPNFEIPPVPNEPPPAVEGPDVKEPDSIALPKLSAWVIKQKLGRDFDYYGDVGLRFCLLPEFAEEGRFLMELYIWARHFDRPLPWKGKECLRRSGDVIEVVDELPPRIDRRLLVAAINSVTRGRLQMEIPDEPDRKFLVKRWNGRLDYVLERGFDMERTYLVQLFQALQKTAGTDPRPIKKLTFDVLELEREDLGRKRGVELGLGPLVIRPKVDKALRLASEDLVWAIVLELSTRWADKVELKPTSRNVAVHPPGDWFKPYPLPIYTPQPIAPPVDRQVDVDAAAAPFLQAGILFAKLPGNERLRYCAFPPFWKEAAFLGELRYWALEFDRVVRWNGEECVRREDSRIVLFNHPPRIDPRHLAKAIQNLVKDQYQVEIEVDVSRSNDPWGGRLDYVLGNGLEAERHHVKGLHCSLEWLAQHDPNIWLKGEKIRLDGVGVCSDSMLRTLTFELEELGLLSLYSEDLIWIIKHELSKSWGNGVAETKSSSDRRLVLEVIHPALRSDSPEETYFLDGRRCDRIEVGRQLDLWSQMATHYAPNEVQKALSLHWVAFIRERDPELAQHLQLDQLLKT